MLSRHQPRRRALARGFTPGFTLAELLIVIAIIVLLIGILLPALGKIRRDAKDMATRAQLDAIGKANETYALSFNGAFGGFMNEATLSDHSTEITSNENLVLSLVGRVTLQPFKSAEDKVLFGTSDYYVDVDKVGSGPQSVAGGVLGTTYGALYPAKADELADIDGDGKKEFVDVSYGLPLLYFRAAGAWAIPAQQAYNGPGAAFQVDPVVDYTSDAALSNPAAHGMTTYDQTTSLLNSTASGVGTAEAVRTLAWLTINTKLSNLTETPTPNPNNAGDVPAGGFFLMATGYDRIYFDSEQVGGAIDNADELANFDDIIIAGGTAP